MLIYMGGGGLHHPIVPIDFKIDCVRQGFKKTIVEISSKGVGSLRSDFPLKKNMGLKHWFLPNNY